MTGAGAAPGDDGRASLYLPLPDNPLTIDIAVDRTLVRSVNAHRLAIHGELGTLLVAVDRYPSRDIEDGEEVYVRLLDRIASEERWRLLARSAARGLASAEPLLDWAADRQSVVVRPGAGPALRLSLDTVGALSVEPVTAAS